MKGSLTLKPKDAVAIEQFVKQVRIMLQDRLVAVKLFGSKATGSDVAESDIDILLVVDETSYDLENQILNIAFDVNLAHDVYISPRVIPQKILEDPVWKITPFLRSITTEGITL